MIRSLVHTFVFAVLVGLYPAMPAHADEIRPALLDIKEQNTGLFAVTWKVPTRGDRILAITPQLPDSLELLGSPSVQDIPGARIEHATYKNNGASLTGQSIVINGLSALQTDVLFLILLGFTSLVVVGAAAEWLFHHLARAQSRAILALMIRQRNKK